MLTAIMYSMQTHCQSIPAMQCMIISSVLSSMMGLVIQALAVFHINFINHNNYMYNHLTLNGSDASGPIRVFR